MPSPSVDGFAVASRTSSYTIVPVLTTSGTADLIMVAVYTLYSGGAPSVTSITASGLTFTEVYQINLSIHGKLSLWSAQASGALSASSITVNIATNLYDAGCVIAFGVSGASATTPFEWPLIDPDAFSVFTGQLNNGTNQIVSHYIGTSIATDTLFYFTGASLSGVPSSPSGFSVITSRTQSGSHTGTLVASYLQLSSALPSGTNYNSTAAVNGSYNAIESLLIAVTTGGVAVVSAGPWISLIM